MLPLSEVKRPLETRGLSVSGVTQRVNTGYIDMQNNIIILPAGKTADDDIYRYNNGNQTLAELQALTKDSPPGTAATALGMVIQ